MFSFKPYYRWITFNTLYEYKIAGIRTVGVLNLIIDGLPSILNMNLQASNMMSFKPYYRWITFNTLVFASLMLMGLTDSFKPYYRWITFNTLKQSTEKEYGEFLKF